MVGDCRSLYGNDHQDNGQPPAQSLLVEAAQKYRRGTFDTSAGQKIEIRGTLNTHDVGEGKKS